MRIVQVCDYKFPATGNAGAERIVERLTKGLQSLGHTVVLKAKPDSKLDYVQVVQDVPKDFDIVHHHGWCWDKEHEYNAWGLPWVSTIHGGGMEIDPNWLNAARNNPHIICVSKFVSDRIGAPAYVHNFAEPDEFIYKEEKQNYFLYIASLDWGVQKGLDIFINLARKIRGQNFVIAGGTKNDQLRLQIQDLCRLEGNLKFAGEVNGKEKAELIANAKAVIIPTQLPDACPGTVSEALISGTPIIASANGAMPELISEQVGYVCRKEVDYVKAITNIARNPQITPLNCKNFALKNYSHIAGAARYLELYQNMLTKGSVAP